MRPIDADELRGIFEYSREHYSKQGDHGIAAGFSYAIGSLDESPTIPNATAELKKLALELLELYEQAEECVIWGYYGEPDMTNEEMEAFVKGYRERIEKLCP